MSEELRAEIERLKARNPDFERIYDIGYKEGESSGSADWYAHLTDATDLPDEMQDMSQASSWYQTQLDLLKRILTDVDEDTEVVYLESHANHQSVLVLDGHYDLTPGQAEVATEYVSDDRRESMDEGQ